MYTNPTKHEYRPVANLTNAVVELPKDYTADITFYVSSELVNLITAVRKSRPGWRCKVAYGTTNFDSALSGTRTAKTLTVFDGDEEIGKVWTGQRYEADSGGMVLTYCVSNARIDRALAKKRHVESKKLQVAAKHMVKSFYAKTVDEKVREVAWPAFHMATNLAKQLGHIDLTTRRDLADAAVAFALANEDAFLANVSQADRERFLRVKAFSQEEADVRRFHDGEKLVFIDRGDGNYIRTLVSRAAEIVSSDEVTLGQLPEHQKLSLSILKLQDVEAVRFVTNHGVRINETTFVTEA